MSEGETDTRRARASRNLALTSRSSATTDSWIEISSQPSSSSVSSAGDDADRLSHRRRLRKRHSEILAQIHPRRNSTAGSSQEEYDESESESDRVLGSSTEDVPNARPAGPAEVVDDDSSTTLGIGGSDNTVFTPQPNAFSHPPSQHARSNPNSIQAPGSYFPLVPPSGSAPVSRNVSAPVRSPQRASTSHTSAAFRHAAPNSNRQADYDAALRASLTTLLSCAAAVQGTPKETDPLLIPAPRTRNRPSQPVHLQLVPDSHFLEDEESANEATAKPRTQPRRASTSRSPKRKARSSSKDRQQAKKPKNATSKPAEEMMLLSPTLMSWMISAGVVLVFSAISFSAGYAWGKEVGRFEGETGIRSGSCGKEVIRSGVGMRGVRWSNGTTSVRA